MASQTGDLRNLKLDVLRRAVRIFLEHAYPDSVPPEIVRKRATWPDGVGPAELLRESPFEHANRNSPELPPVFALRLGNLRYPHMKLQVQPWPNDDGFLLSVNTHDQLSSIAPGSSEAAAFRALQAENQRYKEAIETAWDRDGLPTFLRYLREYLAERGTEPS